MLRLALALGSAACALPALAELEALDRAAQADRLCPSARLAAPAPADVAGCTRAWCTAAGAAAGDSRFCVCQRGADGDEPRFEYLHGGRRWPAEVSPMMGPDAFELTQADVDGDGRNDWLLEQRMSVSNGMGVAYSRLCTWAGTGADPVCRDVEEWGSLSVLVREGQRRACSLVDAGWRPGGEPGRVSGTYAVGQLLRFERGRWRPTAERPPVARRLLRGFEQQRQSLPARNRERLWYQSSLGRSVRCPDSLCDAGPAATPPDRGR
jgi:hypothetical protein